MNYHRSVELKIIRRQVQQLAFESRSMLLSERNLLVGKKGIFVGHFEKHLLIFFPT